MKNLMRAQRFGAPDVKKGSHRADEYSETAEKAEARACGGDQGPQETRGLPPSKKELFVLHLYCWTYQDSHLRDGEVKGG